MNSRDAKIVKSVLGEDVFDDLEKFEIYKPETATVVDPDEIKVALQIVPRTILSYLFANLKWKEVGESCDLELPFCPEARLHVDKKGPDNYHGELTKAGKVLSKFQHRSLPSIGLILLTSLELYDISQLDEIKSQQQKPEVEEKAHKLQDIIDDRLAMHRMVQNVVDRKISEREAIDKLIKEKLNYHIMMANSSKDAEESMEDSKKTKLRQFLENRERRRQESVEIDKNEITCPDCDTTLWKTEDRNKIKLCICYGENMNREIKFTKSEDGKIKLKFPKSFDIENVEMLLDAIKNKTE